MKFFQKFMVSPRGGHGCCFSLFEFDQGETFLGPGRGFGFGMNVSILSPKGFVPKSCFEEFFPKSHPEGTVEEFFPKTHVERKGQVEKVFQTEWFVTESSAPKGFLGKVVQEGIFGEVVPKSRVERKGHFERGFQKEWLVPGSFHEGIFREEWFVPKSLCGEIAREGIFGTHSPKSRPKIVEKLFPKTHVGRKSHVEKVFQRKWFVPKSFVETFFQKSCHEEIFQKEWFVPEGIFQGESCVEKKNPLERFCQKWVAPKSAHENNPQKECSAPEDFCGKIFRKGSFGMRFPKSPPKSVELAFPKTGVEKQGPVKKGFQGKWLVPKRLFQKIG